MNRQEKRQAFRKLQKDIVKSRNGTITRQGIQEMSQRVEALRAEGLLKKKPVIQRFKDFVKGIGRQQVGFKRA